MLLISLVSAQLEDVLVYLLCCPATFESAEFSVNIVVPEVQKVCSVLGSNN